MSSQFFGRTVGFRKDDVLYYQVFKYEGKPRIRLGIKRPSSHSFSMFESKFETETLLVTQSQEVLAVLNYLQEGRSVTEEELLSELDKP